MVKQRIQSDPNKSNSNKKMKKKITSKKLLSVSNAAVVKNSKPPKDNNPFETIWYRRKFDIIGKKRKGEEKRTGLARSRAIEKAILLFYL
ncbi:hypothetical protein BVC80_9085g21 [Macleaya cordata]|uniref:Uncharacterized protein n=1 Tax=Macleaya cordata TaxID=56857 RepID=A0A200PQY3_MACCD|nr:hypothetical protein BVC80_9085g21 [Macleaya cordata]